MACSASVNYATSRSFHFFGNRCVRNRGSKYGSSKIRSCRAYKSGCRADDPDKGLAGAPCRYSNSRIRSRTAVLPSIFPSSNRSRESRDRCPDPLNIVYGADPDLPKNHFNHEFDTLRNTSTSIALRCIANACAIVFCVENEVPARCDCEQAFFSSAASSLGRDRLRGSTLLLPIL